MKSILHVREASDIGTTSDLLQKAHFETRWRCGHDSTCSYIAFISAVRLLGSNEPCGAPGQLRERAFVWFSRALLDLLMSIHSVVVPQLLLLIVQENAW